MLKIVSGDIIENANKYDVEAIVNPNNKYMNCGCGVCGAVYNKAGINQLETYCHNKWVKDMEVNEIRITPRLCYTKRNNTYIPTNLYRRRTTIRKAKRVLFKII